MSSPLITVVSACYNHAAYLEACILSVREQTYPNIEHLIVNDGSTDGSGEVAEKLAAQYGTLKRPIKIIHQQNINQAGARNRGIRESQGEYVLSLDTDDTLTPDAISKLADAIEAKSVDIVTPYLRTFGATSRVMRFGGGDVKTVKEKNTYVAGSLFKKKAWEQVGGYDQSPTIQGMEDWLLWIEILKAGFNGYALPEVLFNYRTAATSQFTKAVIRCPQKISYIVTKHPELYDADVRHLAGIVMQHQWTFDALGETLSPLLGKVTFSEFITRRRLSAREQYAITFGAIPGIFGLGVSATLRAFGETALKAALEKTPDLPQRQHPAYGEQAGLILWKLYRTFREPFL